MAGKWEGFTEEDIGHYLHNNDGSSENVVPKRQASNLQGSKKKNVTRERMLNSNRKPVVDSSNTTDTGIPAAARLSSDLLETVPLVRNEAVVSQVAEEILPASQIDGNGYKVAKEGTEGTQVPLTAPQVIGEDASRIQVSATALEVFQARQKMLEEQNRRRKEILARMLSDRKKQTTEEAKRLQNIQEELQKMDILLSSDVGILRNQIEVASLEFADAQKKYNRAEKEFLDAKQCLFTKLERKELLTRHLCTIIEESEMRKAHKLSELMEKLNIGECHVQDKAAIHSVIKSPYFESASTDLKDTNKTVGELESSSPETSATTAGVPAGNLSADR